MIARMLALAGTLLLAACGQPATDWPPPSPALWRAEAPNGKVGWLFGTVHALPDGAQWRTPAVDSALSEADLLIVEIGDPGADGTALFARLSNTPGQKPLSARVPAAARPDLAELLERTGQSESAFASVETWAAALMLASGTGGDPANGVDRALVAEAGRVQALETREGQLRLFDTLPEDDQVVLLTNALAEANAADPQRPIRAWLTGDMAALERLSGEGLLADASLRKTLLTARNKAWIGPVAAAIARGDRPLVAVGAVHMAGPEGLPALLTARGYRVTRVQ